LWQLSWCIRRGSSGCRAEDACGAAFFSLLTVYLDESLRFFRNPAAASFAAVSFGLIRRSVWADSLYDVLKNPAKRSSDNVFSINIIDL
jgi:hypothetical protein